MISILSFIVFSVISAPASAFIGPIAVITGPGIVGSMSFGSARLAYGVSHAPRP